MKEIILVLVLALGPQGYQTHADLERDGFSQEVARQFAPHLRVRFGTRIVARDNARFRIPVSEYRASFQRLKSWQLRQKALQNNPAYIALPPSIDPDGTRWMWGVSDVCKPLNGLAVGVAQRINHIGQNRIYVTHIIAAHEIGHLLGARHNDSKTSLMHEAAGGAATLGAPLSFDEKDFTQMRGCLSLFVRRKK